MFMEITDSMDELASPGSHSIRKIQVEKYYKHSDGDFDEDDTEYSIDSDGDEIVIRTNYPSRAQENERYRRQERTYAEPENPVDRKRPARKSSPTDSQPEAMPRLSRRDSSKRGSRKQTSSEPPHNRVSISKYESTVTENGRKLMSTSTEIVGSKRSLTDRSYQSETELAGLEPEERNVPKYMEWYYNKKKSSVSGRTSTESSKSQPSSKKKVGAAEKRVSKTRITAQPKDVEEYDETGGRYKPEPAPRKSPPKGSRLLKEDRALNKQHKPKIETDTNHPLLQHSEHRFERENALEVPAAPTKLPHYMYPETPPHAAAGGKESKSGRESKTSKEAKPKPSPIRENEVKVSNSKIYVEHRGTGHPTQKQLNASTLEDDHDSGIAMNSLLNSLGRRNPIAEKKSVFSIAYDDVSRVKKINSGGESPQYS